MKVSLKSKNIEVELKNENDEIFEKYADEVIYLLEKSQKEILIIEDLDRFERLDIFNKLRELNIKLNYKLSEKNRHFKFIYCIHDDLFESTKERIKFFDIIIPVISHATASNSYDLFEELFNKSNNENQMVHEEQESNESDLIDKKLLRLISVYIDDMRTIYIMNIVYTKNN